MQALLHATAHNTLNEMIVSTLDCTRIKNRSTVFRFSLESVNIKFVKRSFMRFQWMFHQTASWQATALFVL